MAYKQRNRIDTTRKFPEDSYKYNKIQNHVNHVKVHNDIENKTIKILSIKLSHTIAANVK